jgi:hypothetical protein
MEDFGEELGAVRLAARHFTPPSSVRAESWRRYPGVGFSAVFQNLMFNDTRKGDFRALPVKHLADLNFRGFWYTDG